MSLLLVMYEAIEYTVDVTIFEWRQGESETSLCVSPEFSVTSFGVERL
jgi:hypothetical protein